MSKNGYDAIVVGAGHNGLVCGAYLARAGLDTLILERSESIGGAVAFSELGPGVRAPALAHTFGRLRTSVVRDLGLRDRGLASIRPPVRALALEPDGPGLTLWGDAGRTAEELRGRSKRDGDAYPAFDAKVRALGSFMAHLHAVTPPDLSAPSLGDAMTGLRLGRALRGLGGRDHAREVARVLPMAVADLVGEEFETDLLRAAVATRGIQYCAMGPWSAGTASVLLSEASASEGGAAGQTVFLRGGPASLATALGEAARSFGATIRTAAPVDSFMTRTGGDRVTGVALASGEEIMARAVVSAVDPKRTLLEMLQPMAVGPTLRWRAENIRTPGMVAKVNLLLSSLPRFPHVEDQERLMGRILVASGIDHLERAFDASKYGRISEEPYLEVVIPTLSDPSLAPEGQHIVSVLMQYAPYHLMQGNWDEERDALGDLVLRSLEAHAPGLTDLVTARQVITPLDLERDYGLTGGHPLHAEPGLDQFFAWRPLLGHAGYRLAIRGLYLCGSGAHPGGGVTGGPGANAAREILADVKGLVRRRRLAP